MSKQHGPYCHCIACEAQNAVEPYEPDRRRTWEEIQELETADTWRPAERAPDPMTDAELAAYNAAAARQAEEAIAHHESMTERERHERLLGVWEDPTETDGHLRDRAADYDETGQPLTHEYRPDEQDEARRMALIYGQPESICLLCGKPLTEPLAPDPDRPHHYLAVHAACQEDDRADARALRLP